MRAMDHRHFVGLHNVPDKIKALRDLPNLERNFLDFIAEHFTDHCVVLLSISTLGREQHNNDLWQRVI